MAKLYPLRENAVNVDFSWQDLYDVEKLQLRNVNTYALVSESLHPLPEASKPLEWLWKKAKSEWSAKG